MKKGAKTSRVSKQARGNKRSKKMPRKSMPRRRSKDMRRPNRSKHSAQRSRTRRSSRHRAYAQPVETNFDMLDLDVRYGSSWFPNSLSSISALWKKSRTTSEESNTAASEVFASPEIVNIIARSVFETSGNVNDVINFAQTYKVSYAETRNMLLDLAQTSSPICTNEDYEFGTQLRRWCTYDAFAKFCMNQFKVDVGPERFVLRSRDSFALDIQRMSEVKHSNKASFLQENCFDTTCFRLDQKTVRHMTIWERLTAYVLPTLISILPTEQSRQMATEFYHDTLRIVIPDDGLFAQDADIARFFGIPRVISTFSKILEAEQTLRLVTIANFLRDGEHAYGKFRFMMDTPDAALNALRDRESEDQIENVCENLSRDEGMDRFMSVARMWCDILDKYREFDLHFIVNMNVHTVSRSDVLRYDFTPFQSTIINHCSQTRDHTKFSILFQVIGLTISQHEDMLPLRPLTAIPKPVIEFGAVPPPPYSYYLGTLIDPTILEQTVF